MLRYKLKTLATRRIGTHYALPMIQPSVGLETTYRKALRAMLRTLAVSVRDEIIPAVQREIEAKAFRRQMQQQMQLDMDDDVFRRLGEFANGLARLAGQTVARILGLEAERHTKTFMATAKRALGVDLQAVVRHDDLEEILRTAATRNAGLITNLGQTAVHRVQQTVTTALLNGTPVSELRKQLAADFAFSDKRAKLIARDQMAKLNADLNRFRHQQAGIERYRWVTSHDERVRPRHAGLDGQIYAYGEPTGAEGGSPPGQPINCRCIAQAIVEF